MNAMQNAAARHEAGRRDRLGNLPDDILLNILEKLGTLDALRTCVLSKRLLRLPAMFSRFDIYISSLKRRRRGNSNIALAAVTEKILRARSPEIPVIRKLRVTCNLKPDECLPITRAFASAMATQEVEDAEFVPLVEGPFPQGTHGHLERNAMRLNTCLGDCPAAFAGLTRLLLHSMRFGEQDIPNILSTCKRLEYLHLLYCDAGDHSVLLVEHSQLVELHIERGKYESVRLNHVPKLQRLTCAAWRYPVPLVFGYVPRLSKLSLVKRGRSSTVNLELSLLLAHVPSISDLHLDFISEKIWVVPERPKLLAPVLGKLEIANLDNLREGCDIAWTMFILEAAPSLRVLCITVWDHWCETVTDQDDRRKFGYCEEANVEWQPSAPDLMHKNLVKLTIHGFQPDANMMRYVRRIMEVGVNVGEISLHDRKTCERCGDLDPTKIKVCPSTYPRTGEEKDMLRVEITKGLAGMAVSPAVIRFRSY